MYSVVRLENRETESFVKFLNNLYNDHWSLSSLAYQKEPDSKTPVHSEALLEGLIRRKQISIYLLKRGDCIISAMRITRKKTDPDKVVFSHVETHPDFQKRGIFGLALGNMCLRNICESNYKYVEITTWSFNRKGIPLYKRGGFRAVPDTNLLMENYLPLIVKHPEARPYFVQHDYIRTLQNKRSFGYDAIEVDGLSVFEYYWKPRKSNDELRVLVDWQKKEIVSVDCHLV